MKFMNERAETMLKSMITQVFVKKMPVTNSRLVCCMLNELNATCCSYLLTVRLHVHTLVSSRHAYGARKTSSPWMWANRGSYAADDWRVQNRRDSTSTRCRCSLLAKKTVSSKSSDDYSSLLKNAALHLTNTMCLYNKSLLTRWSPPLLPKVNAQKSSNRRFLISNV